MHFDASKISGADFRRYETVEVDGLGTVRLGSFSARCALEFRKLLKKRAEGEDIELALTKLMLVGSVVDQGGKAVFDDASADTFLDRITPDMAAKLVNAVNKLQMAGMAAADANPSSPSPSAA